MFRSPSISIQLLAVTTCLLGGCEKRTAAPAAEREHRSSARSSLRASDEALRGGDRRERTAPRDVLEAIRILSRHGMDPSVGNPNALDAYMAAEDAIKRADPEQFEAIMKEIGQLEDFVIVADLQAMAIFHLAAGQDLVESGEVTLKRFPPGEDRSGVLNGLASRTQPSATDALDFWRSLPTEERAGVADLVFLHAASDLGTEGLAKWKEEGYRLSEEETLHMMRIMALSHINTSPILPPIDGPAEYPDLIEAIGPLEKEGVLPKGAADELILQYLNLQSGRGGEPSQFSGMPSTQAWVEELRKDGFDSLYSRVAAERPHRFFTDIGLHDLPEEKVTIAWEGWLGTDPVAAREWWFGEKGEWLLPSERDSIHAGFASHAMGEGNVEAAREWGNQISDPELRAKTLSGLPE